MLVFIESTTTATTVLLHFDLVFTPNKPLDTTMHFQKQRYYQMESTLVPAATLLEGGVNIANVHQGNPYAAPCSTHLTHSSSSRLLDQVPLNRCFDDGGTHACANRSSGKCGDADWMLLATSGLQFGVMNDMLTDINVFRGMVFGMWARPPYSSLEQNHHLWGFVTSSGISNHNTEMLGYWADEHDWHAVVTSSVPAVKVTGYLVQPDSTAQMVRGGGGGQLIIACASWAVDAVTVTFTLDHGALGAKIKGWDSDPSTKLEVVAPSIPMVQQFHRGSHSLERWEVGARSSDRAATEGWRCAVSLTAASSQGGGGRSFARGGGRTARCTLVATKCIRVRWGVASS
eukprot:COSAG01_NODE_12174_length_1786_cov_3.321873_1_plen_344_part_00